MGAERHILYTVTADPSAPPLGARVPLTSELVPLYGMKRGDWRDVKSLQGALSSKFLRLRYGSPEAHLLLVRCEGKLAHVEWVVPSAAIRAAYPFVGGGCFAIIACVTAPEYRGQGIYPSQIRHVASSPELKADAFYIWAHEGNTASLRGIERAGGERIGTFLKYRPPLGLFKPLQICIDRSSA